jgi:hypothetical protein
LYRNVTYRYAGFFFSIGQKFPQQIIEENKSVSDILTNCKKSSTSSCSFDVCACNNNLFILNFVFNTSKDIAETIYKGGVVTLIESLLNHNIKIRDFDEKEWDDPDGSYEGGNDESVSTDVDSDEY